MSGASVPRTEKQQGVQTEKILPIKLGSTYSPTQNKGGLSNLDGGARDTHLSRQIPLGDEGA